MWFCFFREKARLQGWKNHDFFEKKSKTSIRWLRQGPLGWHFLQCQGPLGWHFLQCQGPWGGRSIWPMGLTKRNVTMVSPCVGQHVRPMGDRQTDTQYLIARPRLQFHADAVHFRTIFASFWVSKWRKISCVCSPLKECGNYWELCVPVGPLYSASALLAMQSAVIARAILSVCLSVRLVPVFCPDEWRCDRVVFSIW